MPNLPKLETFAALLHEVQRIKRVARRPNEREYTSTAEHTFELALMAWYVTSVHKLDLDLEKILTYALAHDLIEAYAGDTFAYDTEAQKTKAAREAAALTRITNEFPEFPNLITTIKEYEQHSTAESKFVYALDKLLDPLNASMEETDSIWKEFDMSLSDLRAYKDQKIAYHELVAKYWETLCTKLKDREEFYFGDKR